MIKYGTPRPIGEHLTIYALALSGMEYENVGYTDDLKYYQGKDSIFKAERIASKGDPIKGKELIDFITESNRKMESRDSN